MNPDELPRLLPLWNSYGINKVLEANMKYRNFFEPGEIPDFGGSGVDINFSKISSSEEIGDDVFIPHKIETEIKLQPIGSTMPFLPPVERKLGKVDDPCMSRLLNNIAMKEYFVNLLITFRRSMKNSRTGFDQKIAKLQKELDEDKEYYVLRVSKKLMDLARTFPENLDEEVSDHNAFYRGGTMATLGNDHLIHAAGRSKFGVTKLKEDVGLDGYSRLEPQLETRMEYQMKRKGYALQIDTSHDKFCVRQKNCLTIYSLESSDSAVTQLYSDKVGLQYVKMSPYLPDEFAFLNQDGGVGATNYDANEQLWSETVEANWAVVDYGSHPRHLVVCQPQTLMLYDIRAKTNRLLMDLNDVENREKYLFTNEKFGIAAHPRDHYHLLCTTHHLLVCDERYPKHPVLFWRHLLQTPPQVCREIQLPKTSDSVVLLCSQRPQEAALVSYRPQRGWVQSLGSLRHTDSLTSNARLLPGSLHHRLEMSYTGGALVPHLTPSGFSVLLQTSLGDVFAQHFVHSSQAVIPDRTHQVSQASSWSSLDPEDPYYVDEHTSSKKINKRLANMMEGSEPLPGMKYLKLDPQALWPQPDENKISTQPVDMTNYLLNLMERETVDFQTSKHPPNIKIDPIPKVSSKDKVSQALLAVWEAEPEEIPPTPTTSTQWSASFISTPMVQELPSQEDSSIPIPKLEEDEDQPLFASDEEVEEEKKEEEKYLAASQTSSFITSLDF